MQKFEYQEVGVIGGLLRNLPVTEEGEIRLIVHRDLIQLWICLWNLVDVCSQGVGEAVGYKDKNAICKE